jgi:hydroxymethylglutaryl-CoA synthase
VELHDLALARGVDPERFTKGIGQLKMGIPSVGEDVVTMSAHAAEAALEGVDTDTVTNLIFATESGVDQSKASGIYVHGLLGLSKRCRVLEVKQACYSATGAIQLAKGYLTTNPDERVLVIAADEARYGLGTPGEATQGCGAAAILLSTTPKILAFDDETGFCVEDVMDFWRPNYRDEALVDGKASMLIYMRCLRECWSQYKAASGRSLTDFGGFCYHLPFSDMGIKAHRSLLKFEKAFGPDVDPKADLAPGLVYNREIGNSYAASLYVSLCSFLDMQEDDMTGKRLGFFSYGSGCMAEFFSGQVLEGYRDHLRTARHQELLANRRAVTVGEYEKLYGNRLPEDGGEFIFESVEAERFVLRGINKHKRIYDRQD